MAHEFLSPEWITAVRELRDLHPEAGSAIPLAVRMNLVVNEGPDGTLSHAHVDSSSGALIIEEGHLDEPDLSVTAMSAFMAGKIRIEGDMAKLMVLQGAGPDESAMAFAEAVRAITR